MNDTDSLVKLTTQLIAEANLREMKRPLPFINFPVPSRTDFLFNTATFAYPDQQPKPIKIRFADGGSYRKG